MPKKWRAIKMNKNYGLKLFLLMSFSNPYQCKDSDFI